MFGRPRSLDVIGRGLACKYGTAPRSAHLREDELPPQTRADLACPTDSEIPSVGASMTVGFDPAARQRAVRRILAEIDLQTRGTRVR